MTPVPGSLDLARRDAGLTQHDLWGRYFAMGGMTPALELEAVCHSAMATTDLDHDRIAHALNERFTELGRNHPVPYSANPGALHDRRGRAVGPFALTPPTALEPGTRGWPGGT